MSAMGRIDRLTVPRMLAAAIVAALTMMLLIAVPAESAHAAGTRTASGTITFPTSVDTATRNKISFRFLWRETNDSPSLVKDFKVGDPGFAFNANTGAWSVSGLDARLYEWVSVRIGTGDGAYRVGEFNRVDLSAGNKAGLNATVKREGTLDTWVKVRTGETGKADLYVRNVATGVKTRYSPGNAGSAGPDFVEGRAIFPVAPGKYTMFAELTNGLTIYYDGPASAGNLAYRQGSLKASAATELTVQPFKYTSLNGLDLRTWFATKTFSDVPASHQFYKDIMWLAASGVTTGYADGTFKPKGNVSREAMIAFLYRLAAPSNYTPPATSPFTDVKTTDQFYKQIAWAYANGISTGNKQPNGTRTFAPKASITREAMAAFMYRQYSAELTRTTSTRTFTDVPKSQKFYTEIMWMSANGISTGTKQSNGTYKYLPKDTATREATAAFLHRAESQVP